jgi:hypothetical protein
MYIRLERVNVTRPNPQKKQIGCKKSLIGRYDVRERSKIMDTAVILGIPVLILQSKNQG